MLYITGVAALNLGDRSQTPGDWHHGSINWSQPMTLDTGTSPFGDYGISVTEVPERGEMPVASHVRACLDLIEQGRYGSAQGMRENFIDNETYTPLIMNMVWKLRDRTDWTGINKFMGSEYGLDWLDFVAQQSTAAVKA